MHYEKEMDGITMQMPQKGLQFVFRLHCPASHFIFFKTHINKFVRYRPCNKKKRKDNHKNKYTAAGAHEDKMAHINN